MELGKGKEGGKGQDWLSMVDITSLQKEGLCSLFLCVLGLHTRFGFGNRIHSGTRWKPAFLFVQSTDKEEQSSEVLEG